MISLSRPRHLVFASLFATLLSLAAGCAEDKSPSAGVPNNAWFNAPPATAQSAEVIPSGSHYLVPPERLEEAEKFLASESISQISPGEIDHFAGRSVVLPGVTRPFLIRALYRSKPEFTIRILDNAFWVTSHDDPNDTTAAKRQPLLIVMEEVPETVFVTLGK